MNYKEFYSKNEKFKHYVDRYCNKHKLSVEQALDHLLVQEVAHLYNEKRAET